MTKRQKISILKKALKLIVNWNEEFICPAIAASGGARIDWLTIPDEYLATYGIVRPKKSEIGSYVFWDTRDYKHPQKCRERALKSAIKRLQK